jgi:hypothetical protein
VVPEGDDEIRRTRGERDLLAERRARRAGLGDPLLEEHLADLRRRLADAEHERERTAVRLAERERELLRAGQREHAEQQLRVEAQDDCTRLRRSHRVRLAEAERRRDELEAQLAQVRESCAALGHDVALLQGAVMELRTTFGREREAARLRIAELERALELVQRERSERDPAGVEQAPEEEARREEMAAALASAVERLRARVNAVGEAAPAAEERAPDMRRPPHKHSMSLITRLRIRRKQRRERRKAAAQPPTIQPR